MPTTSAAQVDDRADFLQWSAREHTDDDPCCSWRLNEQQEMLRMQVNAAQVPMLVCELCAGGHATQDCQVGNTFGQQEQVNFANNVQRGQGNSYGNPYPHAYNPNWRTSHLNFWGNNNNQ